MFTQDQLNIVVRSYLDDAVRIMEAKANYALTIEDLRKQLAEKNKKIEELEKERTQAKESQKPLDVTVPSNGNIESINSTP